MRGQRGAWWVKAVGVDQFDRTLARFMSDCLFVFPDRGKKKFVRRPRERKGRGMPPVTSVVRAPALAISCGPRWLTWWVEGEGGVREV